MKEILDYIKEIKVVDTSIDEKVQKQLDSLTKPPGSLGRLEEIVKDVARISQKSSPKIRKKTIFVMAGDHGVAESGVSAFPAEVTPQMVLNFLNGGAAINVLASHAGCETKVVDMGVNYDFQNAPGLIDRKIGHGTKNIANGPAMSEEETVKAVMAGIRLAEEAAKDGSDIIGTGEMGIANTTPSTAIFCALLAFSPEDITGSGTGLDEKGISLKAQVIQKALKKNEPYGSALETLMKLGGFEIAGLVGLILGSAKMNVPVVVDGFISTAAALVAMEAAPYVRRKLFFAHLSDERGHKKVLEKLDVKPILDLDMRLGEGSGAALAISVIDASLKIFNEMATFESAGVADAV